jgi:hypothetical protein
VRALGRRGRREINELSKQENGRTEIGVKLPIGMEEKQMDYGELNSYTKLSYKNIWNRAFSLPNFFKIPMERARPWEFCRNISMR